MKGKNLEANIMIIDQNNGKIKNASKGPRMRIDRRSLKSMIQDPNIESFEIPAVDNVEREQGR